MNQKKPAIRLLIFTCLMIISSDVCFAQTLEEPIEISSNGQSYLRNGQSLDNQDLKAIMRSNTEAMAYMRTAGVNTGFATVLSITGGVLTGIPVGTALGGGDPNWALAGIGVGLFLLSIPLEIGHNKNVRAAVDTYNQSLDKTSSNLQFKIGISATGLGLQMKF